MSTLNAVKWLSVTSGRLASLAVILSSDIMTTGSAKRKIANAHNVNSIILLLDRCLNRWKVLAPSKLIPSTLEELIDLFHVSKNPENQNSLSLNMGITIAEFEEGPQTDVLFDSPTHDIAADISKIIKREYSDLAHFFICGNITKEANFITFLDIKTLVSKLESPARENFYSGFEFSSNRFKNTNSHRTKTLQLLHSNFTDLEIPTIEICTKLLILGAHLPFSFLQDMAKQMDDEARHAKMFITRFLELGGTLDDIEIGITPKLWLACYDQSVEVQLAIHQCYGEWIGIDGAIWFAKMYKELDDSRTEDLFNFVVKDEITHVQIGMRWLRYLCPNKSALESARLIASGRRSSIGKVNDGALTFPLNLDLCEISGLEHETISMLKRRYAADGSKFFEGET